jgi:hypothetical protein
MASWLKSANNSGEERKKGQAWWLKTIKSFRRCEGVYASKPHWGGKPLPVALRQIGTTGNLPLHRDPKSVA